MSSDTSNYRPAELWVTADDNGMQFTAWITHSDETISTITVTGRSLQSAQRQATAHAIRDGYRTQGRWTVTATDDTGMALETVRRFRRDEVN